MHEGNVKNFSTVTFREATDLLAVPLERIAEITGRSYATILSYRTGDREAPPEVLRALAEFMRKHSKGLNAEADRLEREANRAEKEG